MEKGAASAFSAGKERKFAGLLSRNEYDFDIPACLILGLWL
jgi:hypothetical protein